MTTTNEIEISMKCRPFTGARLAEYQLCVESDGSVLAYDTVAEHYTRCHSLTARDIRKAQKLAGVQS
jgi:hypothetical protein